MARPADRDRRRRPRAAAAVLAGVGVLLLPTGGAGPARAQAGAATQLLDQFGGFELTARGNGLQLTYDSPGLVPVGPALQVSVPEALATSSSGTNYALASIAYPGPVLADLRTVLAQSNPDAPAVVPPYPVRAEAFFPSGPGEEFRSTATAQMRAITPDAASSVATASSSSTEVAHFVDAGSVATSSQTRVEHGKVTSRARVVVDDTDILGGLFHVESVITDLVAVSDARTAASDGRTTVNGLTFLGLAATLDADGLRLVEKPPPTGAEPGPLDPVLGPVLGEDSPPIVDPAQPLAGQLNQLITSTLGATATLGDLLEEHGVRLRLLDPVATADKGTATRTTYGLQLEITYTASGDPRLAPLLEALLPAGRLPSECPVPGAPIDCSPEGLVSLLTRTHISNLGIGAAEVKAAATGPFEPVDVPMPPAAGLGGGALGELPAAGPSAPAPGFTTPAPGLPPSGAPGTVTGALSALGRALPAVLVLLLVLSAPLWAGGSRRLADAVLAGGAARCPDGADRPGRADS